MPTSHNAWAVKRSLAVPEKTAMNGAAMSRQLALGLYVLAMVALVVGFDIVFFRNRFWERLIANMGIVLLFGVGWLVFFRRG